MNAMRGTDRKRAALLAAALTLGLTGQLVLAGPHLACHADECPTTPAASCSVCAHLWLSPAAPGPDLAVPPPPIGHADAVPRAVAAPVTVAVTATGRSPPFAAS